MKLNDREIALLLDDAGRAVLELAKVRLEQAPAVQVRVEDTDDLGIWARIGREDGEHLMLIRWEYVLSVDFPAGPARTVGVRT